MTLFPTTRTSTVLDLASNDDVRRLRSHDAIVRAYWHPVLHYICIRWSCDRHRAEDVTQSFFETALTRNLFAGYQRGRARFRTFLRTCLERHLIDLHRMDAARGGKQVHVALDLASCELHDDPHQAFDAEWLRTVMRLAVDRLEARLRERGKPVHAALFHMFHVDDERPSYAEAAERHGISVLDVTNWLHVARREFRRVALELLAELTIDDDDFASEAMEIFGINVRAGPERCQEPVQARPKRTSPYPRRSS